MTRAPRDPAATWRADAARIQRLAIDVVGYSEVLHEWAADPAERFTVLVIVAALCDALEVAERAERRYVREYAARHQEEPK